MCVARTDRLVLRHYREEDAPTLLAQLNDPAFHRYIGDRGVRTLDEARRYLEERIAASYARHGFGMYLVELEDGTPVGMTGLVRRDGLDDADLGFAFLPDHRRRGFALEASRVVLKLARRRFGLGRVVAITSMDNAASARLLARLGFAFERLVVLPGDDEELRLWGWTLPEEATPAGPNG